MCVARRILSAMRIPFRHPASGHARRSTRPSKLACVRVLFCATACRLDQAFSDSKPQGAKELRPWLRFSPLQACVTRLLCNFFFFPYAVPVFCVRFTRPRGTPVKEHLWLLTKFSLAAASHAGAGGIDCRRKTSEWACLYKTRLCGVCHYLERGQY